LTQDEPGRRDSSRPTYGVAAADTDGDGDTDLLVCAYGRQWNLHWRNDGDRFTEIAERTTFDGDDLRSGVYPEGVKRDPEKPFRSNGNTFDVQLADFDEDGDLDAFLAEICHWWAGESSDRSTLLINASDESSMTFRRDRARGIDRPHASDHWNEGDLYAAWADVDGDGRLDLWLASGDYPDDQRLRLFHQVIDRDDPRPRFEDATARLGIDWEGSGCPSIGDVDRDGDPDIVIGRSLFRLSKEKREELGTHPGLWINHRDASCPRSRVARIRVRGRGAGGTNTFGIGCRLVATSGDRTQHRTIHGGSGHSGHQDPPEVLVSFPGSSSDRFDLEIRWADAKRTRTLLEGLSLGNEITIHESTGEDPPRVETEPLHDGGVRERR
ncbi:MAG: VCBS repeat-containing protein, partial [Planctomycetes bacterium]|nr:VCBS repeat-containing protein [Planctomycetota bacterium]